MHSTIVTHSVLPGCASKLFFSSLSQITYACVPRTPMLKPLISTCEKWLTRLVHIINILRFDIVLRNNTFKYLKPSQNLFLRDFDTCLFNGFGVLRFKSGVALEKPLNPFLA